MYYDFYIVRKSVGELLLKAFLQATPLALVADFVIRIGRRNQIKTIERHFGGMSQTGDNLMVERICWEGDSNPHSLATASTSS